MCGIPLTSAAFQQHPVVLSPFFCLFFGIPQVGTCLDLPLLVFARLSGKSRDQINRDIKARRLLSLSLGNRGQRIPDWQLDPLLHKLVLAVLMRSPDVDAWRLYH